MCGFEGINLDLLSPEQVAQFEADVKKVGLSLQQLIQKKKRITSQTKCRRSGSLGIGGGEAIYLDLPRQLGSIVS